MKPLRQALVAVVVVFASLASAPPTLAQPAGGIAAAVDARTGPHVDGFDVEQVRQLAPGTPLRFGVYGSPGGSAMLRIDGAAHTLPLDEVQAGVYEGTYVIAAADRIVPDSRVTADLWLAGRSATVVLEEPLLLGAAPHTCADCAVVETIRAVQERDRPGYVGAMTGGVLGAILGSQVGSGDGRKVGGILGAVGGAVVGREIERQHGQRTRYEIAVRGSDGVVQTRRYDHPPPLRVGDRVRIRGGSWVVEPPAVMP